MSPTKTLGEIAQDAARKRWGFVPNREVKAIHFANGFFRTLAGRIGSPTLVRKAAGKYMAGKSRTTNAQFVRDAEAHLDFRDQIEDPDAVKYVRMSLDLMLSQDRGVYASGPYSFTATHWKHTSSDPSDQHTGRFMAQVLQAGSGADTVQTFRQVLDRPDDVYRMTVPLLDDRQMGPPPEPNSQVQSLISKLTRPEAVLYAFQQAAGRLARHTSGLEKTTALQRIVTLGCFGIFLHLVNSTVEAVEGRRVPLLLCKRPPRKAIREASRRTFTLARQRITYAFEEELAAEMQRRGQSDLSAEEYSGLMHGWLVQAGLSEKDRKEAEELYSRFREDFTAEREGANDAFEAFVRAATPTCFEKIGPDPPSRCAIRISTRGGLLGPFRGGKKFKKYYRPAPQFMDMLPSALLEPGEEVPATTFWEKAWTQFGVLTGARSRHDAEALRKRGIRQLSINYLSENAHAIHDHLTRLGHARTYADGVTFIRVDQ